MCTTFVLIHIYHVEWLEHERVGFLFLVSLNDLFKHFLYWKVIFLKHLCTRFFESHNFQNLIAFLKKESIYLYLYWCHYSEHSPSVTGTVCSSRCPLVHSMDFLNLWETPFFLSLYWICIFSSTCKGNHMRSKIIVEIFFIYVSIGLLPLHWC